MKKKLTALLSLVLTAVLTIPVLAGTKQATVKAADSLGHYTVEVDGKETGVEIPVMLPLGKMAKATGMKVTKNGKNICLDTGEVHMNFTVGKDAYSLTTSIEGAEGATGIFSLGCAPYIVKKTTYVPLSVFWILEGNNPDMVSIRGQKLQIQTAGKVQIPNPFVDYQTLAEAQKAVGFPMQLPEKINTFAKDSISVMSERMIQVIYRKGADDIFIRKATGSDDISGVYENYEKTEKVTAGSVQAELRGDGTKVYVAVWTDETYAYSIYASAGMPVSEMTALIRQVK